MHVARLCVDLGALLQQLPILAEMSLLGSDELDGAVTMFWLYQSTKPMVHWRACSIDSNGLTGISGRCFSVANSDSE
jgi:hypothetical protein